MTIHPHPRRPQPGLRLAAAGVALLAAAFAAWMHSRSSPPAAAAARAVDGAGPEIARVITAPVGEGTPAPDRIEAVEAPAAALALPTFEELVDQLVAIGRRTAALVQEDELDAAQTSDTEARALLGILLARFADAGERALALLADPDHAGDPERGQARTFVLRLVLAAELARRHEIAVANADHSRIEPLVGALLGVLPQSERTIEFGVPLLDRQPYLRAAHELAVLDLVQAASQGTFPRPAAVRLLSTLWDNLRQAGVRTSAELSQLAMLLLGDADPTRRIVACRQLLADPRLAAMALAWLREHADRPVAVEVATLAASELDPATALRVLRELAPILDRATNAYLVLGARDPELVADAYRELLAANTQPDVRTDLVAGIGFTGTPTARLIAELALHNDPAPAVRIQAGFVLTATADPDAGEQALQQLLDDPRVAHDPSHLGAIVIALHNLEAGGATNQIDRLGRRLRTLPLSESSRQSLEALLARSLPGGAPR